MNTCIKAMTLTVAGSNPAAWWKMEEASGSRIDAVNALALPLTIGSGVGNAAGIVGNGMNFVLAGNASIGYGTAFSGFLKYLNLGFDLFAWVNLAVLGGSGTKPLFTVLTYDPNDVTGTAFSMVWDLQAATLQAGFVTAGVVQPASVTVAFNPSVGGWHLIRGTYNKSTGKASSQIDNGAVNTSAGTQSLTPLAATGACSLKLSNVVPRTATLRLDEVSVWPFIVSNSIANEIWNSGAGHTYPL